MSDDLMKHGYAPGNYHAVCFDCKAQHYNSDKRSVRCKSCAQALRICELEAENAKLRNSLKPAYCYDPSCWESTHDIEEISELFDGSNENGPFITAVLAKLPYQFAVRNLLHDNSGWSSDFDLFETEDQAIEALNARRALTKEIE